MEGRGRGNIGRVSTERVDDENEYYPLVIDIQANQWLFTLDEFINKTPSRHQGIEFKHEMILRHKGALLILRLVPQLKVSHRTLYYAWTYYHRFYMRVSYKVFGQYETLALLLFLLCKTTENHKSYKELIPLVVRDTTKGKIPDCKESSKEFWKWRDTIESYECILLEWLCFDLTITVPYEFTQLMARSHTVQLLCGPGRESLDSIMSSITLFIDDSMLVGTALCCSPRLLFVTGVVATAYSKSLPVLLDEVPDLDVERSHLCYNNLISVIPGFPVEYLKRFERYKPISLDQWTQFCNSLRSSITS